MDIELRHLRYFVAVAEELHFGRAAERLSMAQPPLSMQIKQLEDRLGVQLFERTRRRVELTAAGRVFVDEARRTLAALQRAVAAAQEAGLGRAGTLRMGFVASAPFNVLPDMLRRFRERYPDVSVTLSEMTTALQVQALHEERIDIGLARLPVESPGLSSEHLLREPLVAALPESHRLARRRRIEVRWLAEEPFIMFPRTVGAGLYDQIVGFCAAAGFSPIITQEVSLMQTIVGLVGAGLGVALVPQSIRLIHGTGVVYRPLVGSPQVEMGMIWRQKDTSPLLLNCLAAMRP